MAQDHGLCREKEKVKWTGARAATAGPCCSCQRDSSSSLQTAGPDNKLLALTNLTILAHMDMNRGKHNEATEMDGAKQNERGQDVDEGSGHGRQRWQANKSLQNKTAAGKHNRRILRPAQAS